ncbi:peptidase inhibitor family I36 protein [Nocardia anaemiae]|uniref:peptidase inhibitor family I36 protein n=1 Tax=Nocardia anaemiae TaxID=263910 RepID=UPI000A0295CB
MKRTVGGAVVVVVAAAFIATLDAGVSYADPSACPGENFCLWPDDNFQPGAPTFAMKRTGGCLAIGAIRSAINNTAYTITVWEQADCSGSSYPLGPDQWAATFRFTAKSIS